MSRSKPVVEGPTPDVEFPAATDWHFPPVSHWPSPNFTVSVASSRLRIFELENFVSEDEARLLVDFAAGRTDSLLCTSFLGDGSIHRDHDKYVARQQEEISEPVLNHYLRRAHRASRVPTEHGEHLQFNRYGVGQFYFTHTDAENTEFPRQATFLVYLQAPLRGGETLFFLTEEAALYCGHRKALCCDNPPEGVFVIKPEVGKAALFYNYDETAQVSHVYHLACPVKEGVKWVSQRWMRYEDVQRISYPLDPSVDGILSGESLGEREWDVREIRGQNPRIYYIERMFDQATLKDIFRSHSITEKHQQKLDITARSFLRSTVEYLNCPEGQELWRVPQDAYAVILVFDASYGTVIFPEDPAQSGQCAESKRGCCLPGVDGYRVPMWSTDALLFYPRKTDNTPEIWGDRYAICGHGLQVMRVIYFHKETDANVESPQIEMISERGETVG